MPSSKPDKGNIFAETRQHDLNPTKQTTKSKTMTFFRRHRRVRSSNDLLGMGNNNNNEIIIPPLSSSTSTTLKPLKSCLSNNDLTLLMGDSSNNSDESVRSSSSSNKNNDGMKRSVSFSNIEIREHPLTLGDHPASSGPALSLDWYVENANASVGDDDEEVALKCRTILLSVDEYENTRMPRRRKPIIFGRYKREMLLRNFGVSLADIRQAERECALERYRSKLNKDDNHISILALVGKVTKFMKGRSSSCATEVELDLLMRRAAIAERIQKEQMERYYEEQRKQLLEEQNMNQIQNELLLEKQLDQQPLMICFDSMPTTQDELDQQKMRHGAISGQKQKEQMERSYEEHRKRLLEEQMNQIQKELLERQDQQVHL